MNALSRQQNKLYSRLHNPCILLRKPQVLLNICFFAGVLGKDAAEKLVSQPSLMEISKNFSAHKPAVWFLGTQICCLKAYYHFYQFICIGFFFLLFFFLGRRKGGYGEELLGSCQGSMSFSFLQKTKLKVVICCNLVVAPEAFIK